MRQALAAACACLALAACGDESKPDVGEIEADLARDVEQQTGTADVRIACPDDVGEGDVCEVTAAGGLRAQVRVTQLEDGARGEVVQP